MSATKGQCIHDQFYDQVIGICSSCSNICHDLKTPHPDCRHFCPDFYESLHSATITLPDHQISESTFLLIPVTIAAAFLTLAIIIIIIIVVRFRYRIVCCRRHKIVCNLFFVAKLSKKKHVIHQQETLDPNIEEDMQRTSLCMSPSSTLVLHLSSASPSSLVTTYSIPGQNVILTDAVVSSTSLHVQCLNGMEENFETTTPKLLGSDNNSSSCDHNKYNDSCRRSEI